MNSSDLVNSQWNTEKSQKRKTQKQLQRKSDEVLYYLILIITKMVESSFTSEELKN